MTGFPVLESDTLEADLGVPPADVDPLVLLDVAGLGWLVEQVGVLREPLDWLAGHGERFEDAVATWRQVATTLDGMARRRSGGWLTGEIAAMSRSCAAVASHVAEVRAITAAVHGVFRDVVALFVREVLGHATVALAAAELTADASLAEFAAWAVGRGGVVLDRITRRLADLGQVMVRILAALKALFGKARDMLGTITRLGG
ncbi:hypothetical protein FHX81_5266 [Saccharothrix saharensis]|uniref:Uncharacterized protein n=1 Tax=Saccharothrix saharensis TaxID=571190 RepID=A0A543JJ61_9PSEU|nr:hypothetical protein [Saccharothrix saharensis]TQM82855.1 hypothetical protein FHX81_5266 [Saccharothrix saharensis]